MRVRLDCFCISFLAVSLLALPTRIEAAGCTDRQRSSSSQPSSPLTSQISTRPPRILGPETTILPAGYSGLSPFDTYLLLSKRFQPKSEYETTQSYNKRMTVETPFGLFYGYSSDHYLPFVQRVESSLYLFKPKYDADANMLTIVVSGSAGNPSLRLPPLIKLESKVIDSSQYIGSNSYGYESVVNRITGCTTYLSLQRIGNPLQIGGPLGDSLIIKIPMSAKLAQEVRDDLSIVILARLVTPFHSSEFNYSKPTISDPTDWNNYEYRIYAEYGGLAVFHTKTGRVLLNAFTAAQ